jgi:hypothetical protein
VNCGGKKTQFNRHYHLLKKIWLRPISPYDPWLAR